MNILISGVNPVQAGHRPRMDYVSSVQALNMALTQAGHKVEVRPVVVGEDLASQYDWAIVFIASFRGFLSVHTLGAIWALHEMQGKCTISFDDWQVRESLVGVRCFAADREKLIEKNPFGYRHLDKLAPVKHHAWAIVDQLVAPTWSWPVLVPAYAGGDLSKLSIPESKIYTYNPSILFKGKYGWCDGDTSAKRQEWVLAALHDHRSWLKKQKLSWPVLQFGHRKQGQERLPEAEIFTKYLGAWGALSPAYKICGSGWWRARYGFAADALCAILGSPEEMAMVCPDSYGLTPDKLEQLPLDLVLEVAKAQREAYYLAAGTQEQMTLDILAAQPVAVCTYPIG